jgi:hypothetical protein
MAAASIYRRPDRIASNAEAGADQLPAAATAPSGRPASSPSRSAGPSDSSPNSEASQRRCAAGEAALPNPGWGSPPGGLSDHKAHRCDEAD